MYEPTDEWILQVVGIRREPSFGNLKYLAVYLQELSYFHQPIWSFLFRWPSWFFQIKTVFSFCQVEFVVLFTELRVWLLTILHIVLIFCCIVLILWVIWKVVLNHHIPEPSQTKLLCLLHFSPPCSNWILALFHLLEIYLVLSNFRLLSAGRKKQSFVYSFLFLLFFLREFDTMELYNNFSPLLLSFVQRMISELEVFQVEWVEKLELFHRQLHLIDFLFFRIAFFYPSFSFISLSFVLQELSFPFQVFLRSNLAQKGNLPFLSPSLMIFPIASSLPDNFLSTSEAITLIEEVPPSSLSHHSNYSFCSIPLILPLVSPMLKAPWMPSVSHFLRYSYKSFRHWFALIFFCIHRQFSLSFPYVGTVLLLLI